MPDKSIPFWVRDLEKVLHTRKVTPMNAAASLTMALSFFLLAATPSAQTAAPSAPSPEGAGESAVPQESTGTPAHAAASAAQSSAAAASSNPESAGSPLPASLDSFEAAQALCDALRNVDDVTFEVNLPPDPPPKVKPKTKAARKRLAEQQKKARAKAERAEKKRLRAEFLQNQARVRGEARTLFLPWTAFSDLLEISAAEEEAIDAWQVHQAPNPPAGAGAAAGQDAQMFPKTKLQKRRITRIDAVELSLSRVFSLFEGKAKLFDLDRLSLRLTPTPEGQKDDALEKALRAGNAGLVLVWKPAGFETFPCTRDREDSLAVSAEFLSAELRASDGGAVLARFEREAGAERNKGKGRRVEK